MSTKRPDEPSEDPRGDAATGKPDDAATGEPDELAAEEPDASPAGVAASQPHDALFRQVFGNPAHAAAVLKSLLPARVAAHIDWDTPFEPTHASVVGGNAEQRHGDLLFKARLVDGRSALLWVLFEHQTSVQRWMPLRLSRMVQDFLDEWHRRNPGDRYLPAVLPVVLHHGPRPWRAPTSLLELTDLSDQARIDLAAHLLSLDFILDDLRTVPDEDIDARPLDPLLRLILGVMKHYRSREEILAFFVAHAADIRELLATEHGSFGVAISIRYTERVNPHLDSATLIRHLTPFVGPGLEHTMLTFEQLLREEEYQKGVNDGVEKGVSQGQRDLLLRQLTRRFGALPAAIADRVARAGSAELERWSDRILTAASLDDVFASGE